jgi:hypothetical protein
MTWIRLSKILSSQTLTTAKIAETPMTKREKEKN